MKERIPLHIPKKVWQQVRYLCNKIYDVEWSGVLFYTPEGDFGKEGFKVTLDYIFPMHKGSATYTEFETDESIIDFLMNNIEYTQKVRGLIHSHGLLSVFFSSTDVSEIVDNSEAYNYYLSLIVNNKGDTCAKIAFRGKNSEETVRKVEYRDTYGDNREFTYTQKVEKEVVFIYNCDITIEEETFEDSLFTSRVDAIIKKADEKRIILSNSKTPTLFAMDEELYGYQYGKSKANHDKVTEGFVKTVIALDALCTEDIDSQLTKIRKKFGATLNETNETNVDLYTSAIEENFSKLYHQYYDDPKEEAFVNTLEECVDIINSYAFGNWVADEIHTTLIAMLEEAKELEEAFNQNNLWR